MVLRRLFAYCPRGGVIAMGDGEELLVHAGDDERPLWRRKLGAPLVAVGVDGAEVVVVTEGGDVRRFEADSGNARGSAEAAQPALGAAFGSGVVAVLVDGGAIVLASGSRHRVELAGATCGAFSRRGDVLALGASDGMLVTVRPSDGTRLSEFQANVGLTDLAADPAGGWLATSGDRVLSIAPDGKSGGRLTGATGHALGHVAFSGDGCFFAFSFGRIVAVLARQSLETVAQLTYLENDVTGLAFGPSPYVGIGITGGDGNKINLSVTEGSATHRTDTHPGREHHSWWVKVLVLPEEFAKAKAGVPPVAPLEPAPAPPATPPTTLSSVGYVVGLVLFTLAVLVIVAFLASLFD